MIILQKLVRICTWIAYFSSHFDGFFVKIPFRKIIVLLLTITIFEIIKKKGGNFKILKQFFAK
jgi:hypothetical protein